MEKSAKCVSHAECVRVERSALDNFHLLYRNPCYFDWPFINSLGMSQDGTELVVSTAHALD